MSESQTSIKPSKIIQYLIEFLLKERLRIGNYNDNTKQVDRSWNTFPDEDQQIVNQVSIQIVFHGILVEEWTVQHQFNVSKDVSKVVQLIEAQIYSNLTQLLTSIIDKVIISGQDVNELTHMILFNDSPGRRSDWLNAEKLKIDQVQQKNGEHLFTISVAYLTKTSQQQDRPQIARQRFLSDDLSDQYTTSPKLRKRSNDFTNFKATKLIQNSNQSSASTQNKSVIVSMFSKKDDFEILSSPEDVDRIMTQEQDDDFEIQMIFIDIDFKSMVIEQKKKIQRQSQQIGKTVDFVFNF